MILIENSGYMGGRLLFAVCFLCVCLAAALIAAVGKIISLRHAADELRVQFADRLSGDTNVGISLSASDSKMIQLAADIDRQLKLLRSEALRYRNGDAELKHAIMGISHDLRTPLTAICGYIELLAQEEMSETAKEYLLICADRTQAMRDLTEELFRYFVIMSTDTTQSGRELLSLNAAIEECIAAYYPAFLERKITPEIVLPKEPVKRLLNRQALSRILENIVSNALKYSDGDFSVTLFKDGRVFFENSAAGLDAVETGHLFERFYTVETGRNSTGLGLSIAKTLTVQQGGQIAAAYRDKRLIITLCL